MFGLCFCLSPLDKGNIFICVAGSTCSVLLTTSLVTFGSSSLQAVRGRGMSSTVLKRNLADKVQGSQVLVDIVWDNPRQDKTVYSLSFLH